MNSVVKKYSPAFFKGCLEMSYGQIYKMFLTVKDLPDRIELIENKEGDFISENNDQSNT